MKPTSKLSDQTTKGFYKKAIILSLPILIQQAITVSINLLDNIMVGSYDLLAVSGVSIANQILFIVNVLFFGGYVAPGIFVSQYYGANDIEGVQKAIRFKVWAGLLLLAVVSTVLLVFDSFFIRQFLQDTSNPASMESIFSYSKTYLTLMVISLVPFSVTLLYTTSLRETGKPTLPMKAGVVALGINFVLNLLLINGYLGMPKMGVVGAAIATITARVVEMLIILIVSGKQKKQYPFLQGLYKTLKVPVAMVKETVKKGLPLLTNEFIWSLGMTAVVAIYAKRGTLVLLSLNITGTVTNLFFIVFGAMATAVSIIVGQSLGAGKLEEAKIICKKLLLFLVFVCGLVGILLAIISPFIPILFNATQDVKQLSTLILLIIALFFPVYAYNSGAVYTIRAGGVTNALFIFDILFIWGIYLPTAYLLVSKTAWSILIVYLTVQVLEMLKSAFLTFLLKKGYWVKNLAQKDMKIL